MTSTPLPAKLILLNDLVQVDPGTKIRFLGCVTSPYSVTTGRLTVQHHPVATSLENHDAKWSAPPTKTQPVKAHIGLGSVGDDLPAGDMSKGSWLNIVGYVEYIPEAPRKASTKTGVTQVTQPTALHVEVQAIMIWDAGSIDLRAYEESLRARLEAGKLTGSGS